MKSVYKMCVQDVEKGIVKNKRVLLQDKREDEEWEECENKEEGLICISSHEHCLFMASVWRG